MTYDRLKAKIIPGEHCRFCGNDSAPLVKTIRDGSKNCVKKNRPKTAFLDNPILNPIFIKNTPQYEELINYGAISA